MSDAPLGHRLDPSLHSFVRQVCPANLISIRTRGLGFGIWDWGALEREKEQQKRVFHFLTCGKVNVRYLSAKLRIRKVRLQSEQIR